MSNKFFSVDCNKIGFNDLINPISNKFVQLCSGNIPKDLEQIVPKKIRVFYNNEKQTYTRWNFSYKTDININSQDARIPVELYSYEYTFNGNILHRYLFEDNGSIYNDTFYMDTIITLAKELKLIKKSSNGIEDYNNLNYFIETLYRHLMERDYYKRVLYIFYDFSSNEEIYWFKKITEMIYYILPNELKHRLACINYPISNISVDNTPLTVCILPSEYISVTQINPESNISKISISENSKYSANKNIFEAFKQLMKNSIKDKSLQEYNNQDIQNIIDGFYNKYVKNQTYENIMSIIDQLLIPPQPVQQTTETEPIKQPQNLPDSIIQNFENLSNQIVEISQEIQSLKQEIENSNQDTSVPQENPTIDDVPKKSNPLDKIPFNLINTILLLFLIGLVILDITNQSKTEPQDNSSQEDTSSYTDTLNNMDTKLQQIIESIDTMNNQNDNTFDNANQTETSISDDTQTIEVNQIARIINNDDTGLTGLNAEYQVTINSFSYTDNTLTMYLKPFTSKYDDLEENIEKILEYQPNSQYFKYSSNVSSSSIPEYEVKYNDATLTFTFTNNVNLNDWSKIIFYDVEIPLSENDEETE